MTHAHAHAHAHAPRHAPGRSHGFSLVEVILASALFALIITTFVGAYLYGEEASALAGNRARAVLLAEEGLEAARNVRDSNFSFLSAGTWGVSSAGVQWNLTGSSDTTGIFTRSLSVAAPDANTRFATSTVTWQQNAQRTGTVSLVTKFTNWLATVSSWLTPVKEASLDLSGVEDGWKVQVSGDYAYVVRNGGTPDFLVIDVDTPASPTLADSLTLTGTTTNIAISGNYAYVTTTGDSQELQIIDISTPTNPTVVGTYNAPGTADANGVYVVGTTVYMVRTSSANTEFLIVNAATPALPVLVGSLELGATGYEVFVSGNSAFVATSHNSREIQVVNVTVPALPTLLGSYNAPGNTDAFTISGFSGYVFLGQGNTFYVMDVTTPATPVNIGSTNLTGTSYDIALNTDFTLAFAATAANAQEFVVVDISVLTNSSIIGTVDLTGNSALYGIAYDPLRNRAYGVGNIDTEEFVVFASQ